MCNFADLPNLQEYFHDDFFTGTLELLYRADTRCTCGRASNVTTDSGPARLPHDVVISEIMWALDDAESQELAPSETVD